MFKEEFNNTSSVISLISIASTIEAPAIEAAIDNIPEPVPISNTDLFFKSKSFNINFNMSCVVSWSPVPNAPWDIKLIFFLSSKSSSGFAITQVSSKCIAGKSYVV